MKAPSLPPNVTSKTVAPQGNRRLPLHHVTGEGTLGKAGSHTQEHMQPPWNPPVTKARS